MIWVYLARGNQHEATMPMIRQRRFVVGATFVVVLTALGVAQSVLERASAARA